MSELIQNPNLSPTSPADVVGLPPSDTETCKKARAGRATNPKSSGNRTISPLIKGLTEDEKVVLDRLLKQIPDAMKDYSNRSSELGKSLYELQQVFATKGRKGRFQRSLEELKIPKCTAYDLIGRYTTIMDLPPVILQAADEAGIDLGAPKLRSRVEGLKFSRSDLDVAKASTIIEPLTKKTKCEVRVRFGPGITDDEKIVYAVYDALRRSTGDLSDLKKKEAVAKALNWYAHYVLRYEQPDKIDLTPTKAEADWVLNPSILSRTGFAY